MAFFPREFGNGFTPFIRFLNEVDSHSRQDGHHVRLHHHGRLPNFQPRFDVRELENAYELHGELPGLDKKDIQLEFIEPQTMLIRGRTERIYQAGTPPASQVEDTKVAGAIAEGEEKAPTTETPTAETPTETKNNHHATVEDADEDGFTTVSAPTPATTVAETAKPAETVKPAEPSRQRKPADKARYWVSERSVGEFSRIFSFQSRVDQDNVTAKLENGILTVVVPKAPKHEVRRINIA